VAVAFLVVATFVEDVLGFVAATIFAVVVPG
jgi:hypothetical protein